MSEEPIANGRESPSKENEVINAYAETLVNLENKDELKQEIVNILTEKSRLEARIKDLETIVDNACSSDFVLDTEPMDEEESQNPRAQYSAPSEQEFVEVLTAPVPEGEGKSLAHLLSVFRFFCISVVFFN